MEVSELSVTAIAVLLALVLIYVHLQNRKYPPGPYGVPLLGYLPFLNNSFHLVLANLRPKYGNVLSLRLGPHIVVVLNDYEAIREALLVQGDTFSGRAQRRISDKNALLGIVSTEGQTWREQRRFVIRALKNLGLGKSSVESDVMEEVDKLSDYLKSSDGKPLDMADVLQLPLLNIICRKLCGKRYESADEDLKLLKSVFVKMRAGISFIDLIPLVKKFIPKMLLNSEFGTAVGQLMSYASKEVEAHEEQLNDEMDPRDLIDMYLMEVRRSERINGGTEVAPFTKSHVIATVFDLTFAGMETSEATLMWSLLYVTHYPELQAKIQRELDALMTNDSSLSPNSQKLAPHTRATLMEVQRFVSVIPIAVPHRTIRDTVLLGHNIPSDTTIFANLYAAHHDRRYWSDPDVFRPERFLDADGQVTTDDHLMPFSTGIRACLGEPLAKTMLFLFFTCLLRRFTLSFDEGQPKPTLEPGSVEVTVRPQSFSLVFKCRD